MPRPPFQLTDDQAKTLVAEMMHVHERHPDHERAHRPFVRDFIRAVHTATGKTFSPAIYQRLLQAYAPTRRPSVTTLMLEKAAFEQTLEVEASAARQVTEAGGTELSLVIQRAVEEAMGTVRPVVREAGPDMESRIAMSQRDFLLERLSDTETKLEKVQAQAARLAAELQAALAVRDSLEAQLAQANVAADKQTQRVQELTKSLDDMRMFSMRAVDAVRGETRAWQDRYAHLEGELKRSKQHAEYFRQIAYQRGAPIPPDLRQEPTK